MDIEIITKPKEYVTRINEKIGSKKYKEYRIKPEFEDIEKPVQDYALSSDLLSFVGRLSTGESQNIYLPKEEIVITNDINFKDFPSWFSERHGMLAIGDSELGKKICYISEDGVEIIESSLLSNRKVYNKKITIGETSINVKELKVSKEEENSFIQNFEKDFEILKKGAKK